MGLAGGHSFNLSQETKPKVGGGNAVLKVGILSQHYGKRGHDHFSDIAVPKHSCAGHYFTDICRHIVSSTIKCLRHEFS